MGQFSVEKPVAPGSALSGNQQMKAPAAVVTRKSAFSRAASWFRASALNRRASGSMRLSRRGNDRIAAVGGARRMTFPHSLDFANFWSLRTRPETNSLGLHREDFAAHIPPPNREADELELAISGGFLYSNFVTSITLMERGYRIGGDGKSPSMELQTPAFAERGFLRFRRSCRLLRPAIALSSLPIPARRSGRLGCA